MDIFGNPERRGSSGRIPDCHLCLLLLHLCPTIRAVVWNPKWCFFINVGVFAFVALYRHMVLSGVMYPLALCVVHSSFTSSGSLPLTNDSLCVVVVAEYVLSSHHAVHIFTDSDKFDEFSISGN